MWNLGVSYSCAHYLGWELGGGPLPAFWPLYCNGSVASTCLGRHLIGLFGDTPQNDYGSSCSLVERVKESEPGLVYINPHASDMGAMQLWAG